MKDQFTAEAQRTQRKRRVENRLGKRKEGRRREEEIIINAPLLRLSSSTRNHRFLRASAANATLCFLRLLIRIGAPALILVFAILACPLYAFAQFGTNRQGADTQGSQANQLPLSGRSGQAGS